MKNYIIFDIETIGLNEKSGYIVEIAALRVINGQITDEKDWLINPLVKVPIITTKKTGIDNSLLANEKEVQDILPEFLEFINDWPIVGHNAISFDKRFIEENLKKYKICDKIENQFFDTMELALFLLPEYPKHKLEYLYNELLNKKIKQKHRAIDDCYLLFDVINKLAEVRDKNWDKNWLEHVGIIAKKVGWNWADFILNNNAGGIQTVNEFLPVDIFLPSIKRDFKNDQEQLEKEKINTSQLNYSDIDAYFKDNGKLKKYLDKYEYRPQQQEMAAKVTESINNERYLIVEAPTGCGKSLAYLLPAAYWSIKNKKPVVISTYTNQLQDQLADKEVKTLSKIDIFKNLVVTVAKGREHYVCLRKIRQIFDDITSSLQKGDLPGLADRMPDGLFSLFIANWVINSRYHGGDYDRFSFWLKKKTNFKEKDICSDSDSCINKNCPFRDKCFVNIMRSKASKSDLIIANHALVFQDMAKLNSPKILPDYNLLVLDEAINIESAITDASMEIFEMDDIYKKLAELYNDSQPSKGVIYQIELIYKKNKNPKGDKIIAIKNNTIKIAQELRLLLNEIRRQNVQSESNYSIRETIDNVFLNSIQINFSNIKTCISQITEFLDDFIESDVVVSPVLENIINNQYSYWKENKLLLDKICNLDNQQKIFFYELSSEKNNFSLSICEKNIGRWLKDKFYTKKNLSIIFTSATLTYNGTFDFVSNIWGLEQVRDKVDFLPLNYYFDYKKQAVLFIFNDVPEKNNKDNNQNNNYYDEVSEVIKKTVIANNGSALITLTNNNDVKIISGKIVDTLDNSSIPLFSIVKMDNNKIFTGSKLNMVEEFKEITESCVIGSAGLKEGVDVPGESLSMTIIVKFPFQYPHDPIFEIRQELYGQGDGFGNYSLPLCVFNFKQAFGRLIRKLDDEGIICLIESKADPEKKKYFNLFLQNLPEINYYFIKKSEYAQLWNIISQSKESKGQKTTNLVKILNKTNISASNTSTLDNSSNRKLNTISYKQANDNEINIINKEIANATNNLIDEPISVQELNEVLNEPLPADDIDQKQQNSVTIANAVGVLDSNESDEYYDDDEDTDDSDDHEEIDYNLPDYDERCDCIKDLYQSGQIDYDTYAEEIEQLDQDNDEYYHSMKGDEDEDE